MFEGGKARVQVAYFLSSDYDPISHGLSVSHSVARILTALLNIVAPRLGSSGEQALREPAHLMKFKSFIRDANEPERPNNLHNHS